MPGGLLRPQVTRPLFWAAALFAFVMAVLPHPPQFEHEPGDKVQHVAAFLTLATLGSLGFPLTRPWKLLLWLSLFGAGIEVVQAIPILHRDSDIVDWLADTLAAALAIGAFAWVRARQAGQRG